MDRRTNNLLMELDEQLQQAYNAASAITNWRLERLQRKLERFRASPDVPPQYFQQALHQYLLRIERETQLLQNIANDLSRTGELAGRIISEGSFNVFQSGYSSAVGEIKAQLGMVGIDATWSEIDRNSLKALFNGQNTRLGQFPGYHESFTQIKARQVWKRGIVGDRRKGFYYYQRALGNLGSKAQIVRRLQNQLVQTLILGESIPQLATRIRRITEGCRMQAVRIARTETLRALNQGKMISYFEAENMGIQISKKWIATLDERTRPDHAAMHGTIVSELSKPFIVNGEELQYPLDPNGSASNCINCRCIVVSVVRTSKIGEGSLPTEEEIRSLETEPGRIRGGTEVIPYAGDNVKKEVSSVINNNRPTNEYQSVLNLEDLKTVQRSVNTDFLVGMTKPAEFEKLVGIPLEGTFEEWIDKPINVALYEGQHYITDGNHRAVMTQLLGKDTIKANVREYDVLP